MARSQSRLAAEIDFDRHGKQHGFIRLPYSWSADDRLSRR
jgi:hypothetical protein